MSTRNTLLLVAIALLIAFLVLNGSLLAAPATVSLGFAGVTTSVGLVLAVLVGVVVVASLLYVLQLQMGVLAASRRHEAELRTQRDLADSAEASRFGELRAYVQGEFLALGEAQKNMERSLREELTNSTHWLAAAIAEVDERLERQYPSQRDSAP